MKQIAALLVIACSLFQTATAQNPASPTQSQPPPNQQGLGVNKTGKLSREQVGSPLKIMPLGDSITFGALGDNAGYRGPLYQMLTAAGAKFVFVGSSANSWRVGSLPADQRQNEGHESYAIDDLSINLDGFDDAVFRKHGGASRNPNGGHWLDGLTSGPNARPPLYPDLILLLVGANDRDHAEGVKTRLDNLVNKIVNLRPQAWLLIARITPQTDSAKHGNFVPAYNQIVDEIVAKYAAKHRVKSVDLNTGFPANGLSRDGLHPSTAGFDWMAKRWFDAIVSTGLVADSRKSSQAASADQSGSGARLSIKDSGAVGDGQTINTQSIQKAIDQLAANGGGTVVIPEGVFVSGALHLKPKVNLHLEKNGVLQCSTDMTHFPPRRIRIEGHFEESFTPALINALDCNGLRITGEGVLDGAGLSTWELFWKLRKESPDPENFPNLSIPRARLAFIENCRDVLIEGVTFKDSQFWNLHLYRCRNVQVRSVRFTIPDDYKWAPSTDGIDLDSCQDVVVDNCFFSLTDDCIALKGSRGPEAAKDKLSPPNERVLITNCVFKRGHGAVTFGSEATIVRDVRVENCKVIGTMPFLRLKLRPDTQQLYENLVATNSSLQSGRATLVSIEPWKQYFDLKGQPAPHSIVRNVTISGINGEFGSLGVIRGNPGQTDISDITLENIDVKLKDQKFVRENVKNLQLKNVIVNGTPLAP
jgi:alpha-L-rhamnosidase